ncbi:protein translocase subunit SecD [Pseudonocardia sulfidoxydans NBRC 16205]|uniref:Protein translocase subunit SecD n=1 Tax=Pseudonocardia sulfidoxydans NBRC 16205 TaxID=1223511 RepID=A0A511DGS6_9PSEU|nr:protein translocase subunit SecD [Pseudonocardia sulfidoxydans]GEL23999.1 protein translocase subunit SecD [Pseudonocardia sulfidoxydans NBRC 16205]
MATTPGRIRPWRYLASFVGIVVVLYALVFFTGDRKATPKLGIDLQGGTQVTLTARTTTGGDPPRDQLVQAQEIIERRVNGLGVSGAEVVLDGTNINITVPGDGGDEAKSLGQTAQLRIRPVLQSAAAGPAAGGVPTTPGDTGQGGTGQDGTGQDGTGTGSGTPATGQPQGLGALDTSHGAVAPVSWSSPLPAQQTPPPTPDTGAPTAPATPGGTASEPVDPALKTAVDEAKQTRQSTDPATLQAALAALDCSVQDPLLGYDDPALPLVACSEDGQAKYILDTTLIEGTDIDNAQAGQNQNSVDWVVSLTFKSAAAQAWGDYTSQNVGKQAAFVLDGQVVSAPTINQPIFGTTEVSGNFNQQRAQDLAGILRYGSLPLSFQASQAETISATLGTASLEAGLIAGAIGLALVFVYCLFYYRILGVLTILSLVLSGLVVYAVLVLLGRWVGLTLDLAGVAGFIVAIGITADSFVIFFERLKDEMREGRTFRAAVPRGWVRARRTILSADAVSFLASAVLYVLAVGQVKGFAFTLGMSTVLDLLVVFLVTHPLVALASNSKVFSSPALSGLGSVAKLGAERRRAAATAGKGV